MFFYSGTFPKHLKYIEKLLINCNHKLIHNMSNVFCRKCLVSPFAFHIAYSAFTAFIVIFSRLNQLETRFYQSFCAFITLSVMDLLLWQEARLQKRLLEYFIYYTYEINVHFLLKTMSYFAANWQGWLKWLSLKILSFIKG